MLPSPFALIAFLLGTSRLTSCCAWLEFDSFDTTTPWINRLVEFTKQVLAQDRVRLIGVCFGHQIIGRALGAKVGRSANGWEASVQELTLTNQGKEVFGVEKLVRQECLSTWLLCLKRTVAD